MRKMAVTSGSIPRKSAAFQIPVAQVGQEHVPRLVRDGERRLRAASRPPAASRRRPRRPAPRPAGSSTGSPKSGLAMSRMPIAAGSPKWIGVPWARGKRRTDLASPRSPGPASAAASTRPSARGTGPPARQAMFVRYIGTFTFCSMCRTGTPRCEQRVLERERAADQEADEIVAPVRVMSVGSSTSSPCSQTRYAGRSVRRSAPGATSFGSGSPGSVTSSSGHGFGLRWQKSRKSNAQSCGSRHEVGLHEAQRQPRRRRRRVAPCGTPGAHAPVAGQSVMIPESRGCG